VAVAHACALSREEDEMHIMLVKEERLFGLCLGIVDEEMETEAKMHLTAAKQFACTHCKAAVVALLETAPEVHTFIIEYAAQWKADYIVVGSIGKGMEASSDAVLLGSVTQQVMLLAACPVVIARPPWVNPPDSFPSSSSSSSSSTPPSPGTLRKALRDIVR